MVNNLFGTDGIRSKVGSYPLTNENIFNLGKSICLWAKSKKEIPTILVANDTRISSSWIKSCLKSGLLEYEIIVYDAQILPTPAVYNLVQKQKLFDFGIVITASHNPYHDNGIKLVEQNNFKLSEIDEQNISQIFLNKNFPEINYEKLGKSYFYQNGQEQYLSDILKYFRPNCLKNIKIAIDCANGATSQIAEKLFSNLGASTLIINDIPDGVNINKMCGATNTAKLQKFVLEQKADIGFAFDGDGDRIIAINKNGEIKDGDDIIALLSNNAEYKGNASIAATIMSNYALELFLKQNNKKLIRTAVGDKYVSNCLAKENQTLGGEQSGHIIMRDYLNTSDSLFASLRIIETIIQTGNWEINLYKKLAQSMVNLSVKSKKDLTKSPFINIISDHESKLNSGRIIVRYSGTEPLLRIMVEAQDLNVANESAVKLSQELKNAFEQEAL